MSETPRPAAAEPAVPTGDPAPGLRLGPRDPDATHRPLRKRGAAEDEPAAPTAGSGTSGGPAGTPGVVTERSRLLAASAGRAAAGHDGRTPAERFAWAAMLTRAEVLAMGAALRAMLAAGAPTDLERGFGVAWRAGLTLPGRTFRQLFAEFAELEITVAGALAGYDLRSRAEPRRAGRLDALLGRLAPGGGSLDAAAGAIVAHGGGGARLGVVAAWNAWAALLYRPVVPADLFDLLTRPWVAIAGPVPDAR